MKKYLSIFELFTRTTIYKVLLVLLAMAAAQIVLFKKTMSAWIPMDLYHLDFQAIEHYSLEWMIDNSKGAYVFGAAFILITAVLSCSISGKSKYTIQRLQVSEKTVFIMQSVYNSLCYILFLGVQTGVFFIESAMYIGQAQDTTNQTVFLAFYRNNFMHSVLPLEAGLRWTGNSMLLVGCAVLAAVFSYLQRRGKTGWTLIVAVVCTALTFVQEIGIQLGWATAFLVVVLAGAASYIHVFRKKTDELV